jgi:hypothetical protein
VGDYLRKMKFDGVLLFFKVWSFWQVLMRLNYFDGAATTNVFTAS